MKDFFIKQALNTVIKFVIGLDKNKSEVKKFKSYLVPLRDSLIELYPPDQD